MAKVGRNQPCPCGSGKKYKRCCLNKPSNEELAFVMDKFNKIYAEEQLLKDIGLHINVVRPIIFQGKKVWACGNQIWAKRPEDETFHEFIIDMLRLKLGKEWWDEQVKAKKKHYIFQCFMKYLEWQEKNFPTGRIEKKGVWSAMPDGYSKYLLSLAFDVFILRHKSFFPEKILYRLRDNGEFQGARYEIAVASIFVRLGYDLDFFDDENNTEAHCEFMASKGGEKILVEAKSRHREGVIHQKGQKDDKKIIKGDVERLFKSAKKKVTDKPFLIFIDVNTPVNPEISFENKQWFQDIKNITSKRAYTESNPAKFNAVIFTNFSFHYDEENNAKGSESTLMVPKYPKYPLINRGTLGDINIAINNYGKIPNIDVDGIYL